MSEYKQFVLDEIREKTVKIEHAKTIHNRTPVFNSKQGAKDLCIKAISGLPDMSLSQISSRCGITPTHDILKIECVIIPINVFNMMMDIIDE